MKRLTALLLCLALLFSLGVGCIPAHAAGNKLIALTFDDGPGPYTRRLLDGLKSRGVRATFFMLGSRAAMYPELVKRAYEEGHQIAGHSYDHPELTNLSDSAIYSQLKNTHLQLDKACGAGSTYLLRPPYGSSNSRVRSVVGRPLILWSIDPVDWRDRDAATVSNRVTGNAFDGAIVLLHDIHSTSVTGALNAIDILKSRGYEFVTVQELFRRRGSTLQNGVEYYSLTPNGIDKGAVSAPEISTQVVGGSLQVTLSAQPGASIYYSTDGSSLNQQSRRYTQPFTVASPCTIRAVAAYNMNGDRGPEVTQRITLPVSQPPELQVDDGLLTLSCSTPGSRIFYTLDGSQPSENSALYQEPFALEPGTVISAYSAGEGYLASGTVTGTYSHSGHFYRDISPQNWFYDDMEWAVSAGYLQGVGRHYFRPNAPITRQQLVTMLYRYAGSPSLEGISAIDFPDVPSGQYYSDAVAWAVSQGLVSGYPDGTFQPAKEISRQEMSMMFSHFLELRGLAPTESSGAAESYADSDKIPGWALEAVEKVTACGLILGDSKGFFSPGKSATRGQTAAVLRRLEALEADL